MSGSAGKEPRSIAHQLGDYDEAMLHTFNIGYDQISRIMIRLNLDRKKCSIRYR